MACGSRATTCPPAFEADVARTKKLEALLASDAEGERALASRGPNVTTCYRENGPGVVAERTLLLDASAGDVELASRIAHLSLHLGSGQTRTSGQSNSDDERQANALEDGVRQRLSARASRSGQSPGP